SAVLCRNDKILHAPVGAEETVMLSVEAGEYYGLNAVGRRIWELLETVTTPLFLSLSRQWRLHRQRRTGTTATFPALRRLRCIGSEPTTSTLSREKQTQAVRPATESRKQTGPSFGRPSEQLPEPRRDSWRAHR
ncbi:MAG: PqqD family protein, partial [Acidobacteriota bacterium]|nr:PqqD family protein [Acidobacteriota bacterium]